MHGIHISHNSISDKGAIRLIRAAASCGHYPRYTSRLPLWLRLECNEIASPQKVVAECNQEGFNVCLMQDGLCSRPDCNHYSGVHVQLPYFLNNPGKQGTKPYVPFKPQPMAPAPETTPEPTDYDPRVFLGKDPDAPEPDWKIKARESVTLAAPAPKRMAAYRPPAPTPQAPMEGEEVDWEDSSAAFPDAGGEEETAPQLATPTAKQPAWRSGKDGGKAIAK